MKLETFKFKELDEGTREDILLAFADNCFDGDDEAAEHTLKTNGFEFTKDGSIVIMPFQTLIERG